LLGELAPEREHDDAAEFDQIAEHYDQTRGGERRGDEYADSLLKLLPAGEEPLLEIGVGTGVVALGLVRRGRKVLGLDVSCPMLARAKTRLGPVLVQSDAARMAIATASIAHAVSVWVAHAVHDPERLFREVARVLRPDGSYVLCSGQRPAEDDVVGQIIKAMGEEVDRRRGAPRPRGVTPEEVLTWAARAGFRGSVRTLDRQWLSRPSQELVAIEKRSWPAMRELDEGTVDEVTKPAAKALRALPDEPVTRRAIADVLVLRQH
jgi:ubiquinone/menaquinone biosynthesis C-methylase UbiE